MHVYDIEQSTNSPLISVIMSYHGMQLGISLVDVIVMITINEIQSKPKTNTIDSKLSFSKVIYLYIPTKLGIYGTIQRFI